MVVVFDVDGVLIDFVKGFCQLGSQWFRDIPKGSDATNPRYGTEHLVGEATSKAIWGSILVSPRFWQDLPPSATEEEFNGIQKLNRDHTVYFATNRMGRYPKSQTEYSLTRCGIVSPTVVVTARKGDFAKAVGANYTLEDKAGNAVYIAYESSGTRSCLLDRPYNRFEPATLGSKVTRVSSVQDFLDLIEKEKG